MVRTDVVMGGSGMPEAVASSMRAWETFYVIVGTAAGALTGLQFVVMTLIGEVDRGRRRDSISAFGTPNIVHFCAVLLATSILSAPWPGLRQPGIAMSVCGVLGVVYSVEVLRRALHQRGYEPVWEDWVWHAVLPAASYATLLVAGLALQKSSAEPLFAIGAALLTLLFIGIHNAWDTVVYVTVDLPTIQGRADPGGRPPSPLHSSTEIKPPSGASTQGGG
jgi:hypothetical protein